MMFVVERRLPDMSKADLAMLQDALVFACDRLTSRGEPVRCVGSAYVPGRACLLTFFQAESVEAVQRANLNVLAPFVSVEAAMKIDPTASQSAM